MFNIIDVTIPAKNSDEIHRPYRETICEQLNEVHNVLLLKCKMRFGTGQCYEAVQKSAAHAFSFCAHSLAAEASQAFVARKGGDRGGSPRPSQAFQLPDTRERGHR